MPLPVALVKQPLGVFRGAQLGLCRAHSVLEKHAPGLRAGQPLLLVECAHQADGAVADLRRELRGPSVHPQYHKVGLRVGDHIHLLLQTPNRELYRPLRVRCADPKQLNQGGAVA